MYFSHIFLKVPFNYVLLSRLYILYSAKGISATDILPVICLGSDVGLNKSKFIIIVIIIIIIISQEYLVEAELSAWYQIQVARISEYNDYFVHHNSEIVLE